MTTDEIRERLERHKDHCVQTDGCWWSETMLAYLDKVEALERERAEYFAWRQQDADRATHLRSEIGQLKHKVQEWEASALVCNEIKRERDEAHGYLSRLLPEGCEPLPTLAGIATQIDNLLAGTERERDEALRDRAEMGELIVLDPLKAATAEVERDLARQRATALAEALRETAQRVVQRGAVASPADERCWCSLDRPKSKDHSESCARANDTLAAYEAATKETP